MAFLLDHTTDKSAPSGQSKQTSHNLLLPTIINKRWLINTVLYSKVVHVVLLIADLKFSGPNFMFGLLLIVYYMVHVYIYVVG